MADLPPPDEEMAWLNGKRQREEEPEAPSALSHEEPCWKMPRIPSTVSSRVPPQDHAASLESQVQALLKDDKVDERGLVVAEEEPRLPYAPRLADYCAPGGTERFLPRPEWYRQWSGRKRPREKRSVDTDPSSPGSLLDQRNQIDMLGALEAAVPQPADQQLVPSQVQAPANGLLPDDAFAEFHPRPPAPSPPPVQEAPVRQQSPPISLREHCDDQPATFGKDFDSALHMAIRDNAIHAALHLIQMNSSVNVENAKGVTPLILASQKGQMEIVLALLDKGASPMEASITGSSALLQAAHFGHSQIVQLLLDKGARIEMANYKNTTPLMRAAQEGHADIVTLLLQRGAMVNRKNNEQMSALMLASQRGHANIVQLLVEARAEVDAMTPQESTSLMLAVKREHVDVVRVLVTSGCELQLRDSRGRTARDMAMRRDAKELVGLLCPTKQMELMRQKARTERNHTMIQLWTLLQQERALVPTDGGNMTIHEVANNCTSQALSTMGQSRSALIRAMTLPAPLLENIATCMPLPHLWDRRIGLITKQCSVDSDASVASALDLIDEVLEEGGFVDACDQAKVTPPTNFSCWTEWKAWGKRFDGDSQNDQPITRVGRPNILSAMLPGGLPSFESALSPSPTDMESARPRLSSNELRRGVGFLQLLAYRTPMLARLLMMPPYNMPPLLIQQLITVNDVQSLSRRMGSRGIHFEMNVAFEMVMLASSVCLWYSRERDM